MCRLEQTLAILVPLETQDVSFHDYLGRQEDAGPRGLLEQQANKFASLMEGLNISPPASPPRASNTAAPAAPTSSSPNRPGPETEPKKPEEFILEDDDMGVAHDAARFLVVKSTHAVLSVSSVAHDVPGYTSIPRPPRANLESRRRRQDTPPGRRLPVQLCRVLELLESTKGKLLRLVPLLPAQLYLPTMRPHSHLHLSHDEHGTSERIRQSCAETVDDCQHHQRLWARLGGELPAP